MIINVSSILWTPTFAYFNSLFLNKFIELAFIAVYFYLLKCFLFSFKFPLNWLYSEISGLFDYYILFQPIYMAAEYIRKSFQRQKLVLNNDYMFPRTFKKPANVNNEVFCLLCIIYRFYQFSCKMYKYSCNSGLYFYNNSLFQKCS